MPGRGELEAEQTPRKPSPAHMTLELNKTEPDEKPAEPESQPKGPYMVLEDPIFTSHTAVPVAPEVKQPVPTQLLSQEELFGPLPSKSKEPEVEQVPVPGVLDEPDEVLTVEIEQKEADVIQEEPAIENVTEDGTTDDEVAREMSSLEVQEPASPIRDSRSPEIVIDDSCLTAPEDSVTPDSLEEPVEACQETENQVEKHEAELSREASPVQETPVTRTEVEDDVILEHGTENKLELGQTDQKDSVEPELGQLSRENSQIQETASSEIAQVSPQDTGALEASQDNESQLQEDVLLKESTPSKPELVQEHRDALEPQHGQLPEESSPNKETESSEIAQVPIQSASVLAENDLMDSDFIQKDAETESGFEVGGMVAEDAGLDVEEELEATIPVEPCDSLAIEENSIQDSLHDLGDIPKSPRPQTESLDVEIDTDDLEKTDDDQSAREATETSNLASAPSENLRRVNDSEESLAPSELHLDHITDMSAECSLAEEGQVSVGELDEVGGEKVPEDGLLVNNAGEGPLAAPDAEVSDEATPLQATPTTPTLPLATESNKKGITEDESLVSQIVKETEESVISLLLKEEEEDKNQTENLQEAALKIHESSSAGEPANNQPDNIQANETVHSAELEASQIVDKPADIVSTSEQEEIVLESEIPKTVKEASVAPLSSSVEEVDASTNVESPAQVERREIEAVEDQSDNVEAKETAPSVDLEELQIGEKVADVSRKSEQREITLTETEALEADNARSVDVGSSVEEVEASRMDTDPTVQEARRESETKEAGDVSYLVEDDCQSSLNVPDHSSYSTKHPMGGDEEHVTHKSLTEPVSQKVIEGADHVANGGTSDAEKKARDGFAEVSKAEVCAESGDANGQTAAFASAGDHSENNITGVHDVHITDGLKEDFKEAIPSTLSDSLGGVHRDTEEECEKENKPQAVQGEEAAELEHVNPLEETSEPEVSGNGKVAPEKPQEAQNVAGDVANKNLSTMLAVEGVKEEQMIADRFTETEAAIMVTTAEPAVSNGHANLDEDLRGPSEPESELSSLEEAREVAHHGYQGPEEQVLPEIMAVPSAEPDFIKDECPAVQIENQPSDVTAHPDAPKNSVSEKNVEDAHVTEQQPLSSAKVEETEVESVAPSPAEERNGTKEGKEKTALSTVDHEEHLEYTDSSHANDPSLVLWEKENQGYPEATSTPKDQQDVEIVKEVSPVHESSQLPAVENGHGASELEGEPEGVEVEIYTELVSPVRYTTSEAEPGIEQLKSDFKSDLRKEETVASDQKQEVTISHSNDTETVAKEDKAKASDHHEAPQKVEQFGTNVDELEKVSNQKDEDELIPATEPALPTVSNPLGRMQPSSSETRVHDPLEDHKSEFESFHGPVLHQQSNLEEEASQDEVGRAVQPSDPNYPDHEEEDSMANEPEPLNIIENKIGGSKESSLEAKDRCEEAIKEQSEPLLTDDEAVSQSSRDVSLEPTSQEADVNESGREDDSKLSSANVDHPVQKFSHPLEETYPLAGVEGDSSDAAHNHEVCQEHIPSRYQQAKEGSPLEPSIGFSSGSVWFTKDNDELKEEHRPEKSSTAHGTSNVIQTHQPADPIACFSSHQQIDHSVPRDSSCSDQMTAVESDTMKSGGIDSDDSGAVSVTETSSLAGGDAISPASERMESLGSMGTDEKSASQPESIQHQEANKTDLESLSETVKEDTPSSCSSSSTASSTLPAQVHGGNTVAGFQEGLKDPIKDSFYLPDSLSSFEAAQEANDPKGDSLSTDGPSTMATDLVEDIQAPKDTKAEEPYPSGPHSILTFETGNQGIGVASQELDLTAVQDSKKHTDSPVLEEGLKASDETHPLTLDKPLGEERLENQTQPSLPTPAKDSKLQIKDTSSSEEVDGKIANEHSAVHPTEASEQTSDLFTSEHTESSSFSSVSTQQDVLATTEHLPGPICSNPLASDEQSDSSVQQLESFKMKDVEDTQSFDEKDVVELGGYFHGFKHENQGLHEEDHSGTIGGLSSKDESIPPSLEDIQGSEFNKAGGEKVEKEDSIPSSPASKGVAGGVVTESPSKAPVTIPGHDIALDARGPSQNPAALNLVDDARARFEEHWGKPAE